jgi:hypothetical protein
MAMGVNIDAVTSWLSQLVFTDALKQASPWKDAALNKPWAGPVAADGTPLPVALPGAITVVYGNAGGHYPAGQYILSYDGAGGVAKYNAGQIVLDGDALNGVDFAASTQGRIVINIATPTNTGIVVKLARPNVDPANPIRNLHLWLPGYENSPKLFHPDQIAQLKGVRCLRFMEWQRINYGSVQVDWTQRSKPTDPMQTGVSGVCLEYMIQFANEVGADPWFCIPHQASDDYVRQFATMVKSKLDPSRKIYIEYSNEIWNYAPSYPQTPWAVAKGKALGLDPNDGIAMCYYYAQRSVEIFNIWEDVFGGHDRLVRVLASQASNSWVSKIRLGYKDTAKHVDALAIAPYFHAWGLPTDPALVTVDGVLAACKANISGAVTDWITASKAVADTYGVALISYEGGHELASNDATLQATYVAACRDPRMYDLYAQYFNVWAQKGGTGVFTHFTYCTWPGKGANWGMLEYQTQPLTEAHRFRAFRQAVDGKLPLAPAPDATLKSLGVYD